MLEANTFSEGDERIENSHSKFSHTHAHTHTKLVISQQVLDGEDCYPPVLVTMGGVMLLYTPQVYLCTGVLCSIKWSLTGEID